MSDEQGAAAVDVSLVLPVFNEEPNLVPVYEEIRDAIAAIERRFEIIFVDDGSSDGSLDRLRELRDRDPRVKVVCFRRNFGQTAALAAGFDVAAGEIIVTLDADGQNDPNDIARMLALVDDGYDVVSGWRHDRKDAFVSRKLPSMIANRLISWATRVRLHDYGCTLKAMRSDVVRNIDLYGELHRFIPAIASWMGVSIAEIKVNHRPRTRGTSKYGITRTMRVLLDLVTVKFLLSYASRPLQFFGPPGLICLAAGGILGVYLTFQRLFMGIPLADRPILLAAVLLVLVGMQFITFGLLGEMQTRIYHEAQGKPIYVIREVLD